MGVDLTVMQTAPWSEQRQSRLMSTDRSAYTSGKVNISCNPLVVWFWHTRSLVSSLADNHPSSTILHHASVTADLLRCCSEMTHSTGLLAHVFPVCIREQARPTFCTSGPNPCCGTSRQDQGIAPKAQPTLAVQARPQSGPLEMCPPGGRPSKRPA